MNRTALASSISREIGIDFAVVGPALLDRSIAARMRGLGLRPDEEPSYLRRVEIDQDERDELLESMLVPETWFFRDDQPFELIRAVARARVAASGRRPLRVLSLPCSNGAEPFSVALALLDEGLSASSFQILAVDLSRRNLESARRGLYRDRQVRLIPTELRQKYFSTVGIESRLDPRVVELVEFRRGNLVDPSLLAGEAPFDLVLCRNVLIYLTSEARSIAAGSLARLLADDGYLIVGHADRMKLLEERFQPLENASQFAYSKVRRAQATLPVPPAIPVSPKPPAPGPSGPPRPAASPARLRPATPSVPGPSTAVLLDRARSLADAKRFDEAVRCCDQSLASTGPDAEAYFLLGLIHQARGQDADAEKLMRKAVYLRADHAEALLCLSLLARRRGDEPEAGRLLARSRRANSREAKS